MHSTVLRNLPMYGQAIVGIWFLLRRGEFHRSIVRRGSQRSPLHRRFTLPEELPVGTWLTGWSRQRCQVQRSIHIPIDDQTTRWILAHVDAFREVHLLFDVATPRTPLRGRKPAGRQEQCFSLPCGLVGHLSPELAQTHIADGKS